MSSFALSWFDKVTTGTKSFVSVIVNISSWLGIGLSILKDLLDQVRLWLITQLTDAFQEFSENYLNILMIL